MRPSFLHAVLVGVALALSAPCLAQTTQVVRLLYPDAYAAAHAHGRMEGLLVGQSTWHEPISGPTLSGSERSFTFAITGSAKWLLLDLVGRGTLKLDPWNSASPVGDVVIRVADGASWQVGRSLGTAPGYLTGGWEPDVYSCDPSSANYQPCLCQSEATPGLSGCCDPASIHYLPGLCDGDSDGIPGWCDSDSAEYDPTKCDCDGDGICDNLDCSSSGYHLYSMPGLPGSFDCGSESEPKWVFGDPNWPRRGLPGWEIRPPSGGGRTPGTPGECGERECEEGEEGEGGGSGGGGGGGGGGGSGGGGGGGSGGGGGGGGGDPDLPGGGWEPPDWGGPDPPVLDDCCKLMLYALAEANWHLVQIEYGVRELIPAGLDLIESRIQSMHQTLIDRLRSDELTSSGTPPTDPTMSHTALPNRGNYEALADGQAAMVATNDLVLPLSAPLLGEGEDKPPVWLFDLGPFESGVITVPALHFEVDWSFWADWRWMFNLIWMASLSAWAALTIFEEFRRY